MIPRVAPRGTSFKGAGLYYLHDKRQEGETIRLSSDRVAWTESRNLMTDDADFSLRIMAATALDKDRLKQEAGIKNTGRKSKGEVYSYSLAWHPDEQGKFSKQDMLQVADQSLKALGAHEHQAVVVAHKDEGHPHIHIILNMVHPATGKNLKISNDKKKLIKWSNEYRKERGEEHIYCPNKAKKFEVIAAKNRGEKVDFYVCPKSVPRQLYDDFKAIKGEAYKNDIEAVRTKEKAKDFGLSQKGRQMNSRHKSQWDALSDNYKLRKDGIRKRYFEEKADAHEAIKGQMKPAFKALYRQQWQERKAFEKREKRLGGKVQNMFEAVKFAKAIRGEENKSIVSSVFSFFSNAGKRVAWLNAKHDGQLRELRASENNQKREATTQLNSSRARRIKSARQDYGLERGALIGRQDSEKADLQELWKRRTAQRKKSIEALKTTGRIAAKDEALLEDSDKITAKRQFQDKAHERARSRGRSRSRKRE